MEDFEVFARRNLHRYVINKLCGIYRIIKDKPNIFLYYLNLFFVFINFALFKRIYIPQIEFMITSDCTLKCEDCCNYIPYMSERINLSAVNFEYYINNLLLQVYKLNSLIFSGGEPLLNEDLEQILQVAFRIKKIEKIYIYTNGTIKFSANLLNILKKNRKKVHIFLSNYTLNEEIYSKLKISEILNQLKENKINYTFNEKQLWIKQDNIKNYNRTFLENKNIFNSCKVPSVSCVLGEVHICPKASSAKARNLIEFDADNFLNLKEPVSKEEIILFYSKDNYCICEYCKGPDAIKHFIKPAIQKKD